MFHLTAEMQAKHIKIFDRRTNPRKRGIRIPKASEKYFYHFFGRPRLPVRHEDGIWR